MQSELSILKLKARMLYNEWSLLKKAISLWYNIDSFEIENIKVGLWRPLKLSKKDTVVVNNNLYTKDSLEKHIREIKNEIICNDKEISRLQTEINK